MQQYQRLIVVYGLIRYLLTFQISVVPLEVKMIYTVYPWPLGEVGCSFATIICELVTYASIVTMVAFSIERYVPYHIFA